MVEKGTSRLFSCPYHAWVFRPDGSLATVPHRRSYPETFDLDDPQNHMRRIEQVQSYRGFVFASSTESGTAGATSRPHDDAIDNLVDRAPGGEIEIAIKLHAGISRQLETAHRNAADIFHPSFVHSSSVCRRAARPRRLDHR